MIIQASAQRLPLADGSVHCVVTSPPYWGLRKYDGENQLQVWGGRSDCAHDWNERTESREIRTGMGLAKLGERFAGGGHKQEKIGGFEIETASCGCGAWRGQLGLEPDPQSYISHMLTVFSEIWRVLRSDGTCWVNMGDCYTDGGRGSDVHSTLQGSRHNQAESRKVAIRATFKGLQSKNLVGMPWRLALALQDAGWYLRRDIIWFKPNPMPESCTDRPTSTHEYVFLLSKRSKYYYDHIATREPVAGTAHARGTGVNPKAISASSGIRNNRTPASQTPGRLRHKQNQSFSAAVCGLVTERNMRSVWTIATKGYRGAHFATFPPEIPRRCIVAGTSEHGVCAACGSPYRRVLDRRKYGNWAASEVMKASGVNRQKHNGRFTNNASGETAYQPPKTTGWGPSCKCAGAGVVPAVVLDPFGGSGTVGEVAFKLGRSAILVDLAYQTLQRERLGLFAAIGAGA